MRATHPSSPEHDDPVTAMNWHRRRIRRARRRSRGSSPRPVSRVAAQPSEPRKPLVRRLVVFVPRLPLGERPAGAGGLSRQPAAVPGAA